ncbi:hypothetical protein GCM10011402_31230 [Paracoccus acridae]|uniref:Uncharacterized protein n=1 Tax=Paracoccus acridae TaxID=1795310 RepID=A0ABQ1VME6_9RHOB|nr:hypothetical protein GCM10011402_31230 [Paracoccus acridae]
MHRQFWQDVEKDIGDRDPTCTGQPTAAGGSRKEPHCTDEEVNGGKSASEQECQKQHPFQRARKSAVPRRGGMVLSLKPSCAGPKPLTAWVRHTG